MQFAILLFSTPKGGAPTRCREASGHPVEGLEEAVREALRQLATDRRLDYAWLMRVTDRALRGRETLPAVTVTRDRVHISKFSWKPDDFALPAAAVAVA